MNVKNIIIGTGTGLAVNSLIEKGMENFWTKEASNIASQGVIRYKQLIQEGKSIEEASKIVENEYPFWKKYLGARRVNGIIGIGLGLAVNAISSNANIKTGAKGTMISGALKFLFPSQMANLEFKY